MSLLQGRTEPGASPPPAEGGAAGPSPVQSEPLSSDFRDCEVETAGDREFRVLFGPGRGCSIATQFAQTLLANGRLAAGRPQ